MEKRMTSFSLCSTLSSPLPSLICNEEDYEVVSSSLWEPKRSSLKLGKFCKLAFKYCGPFEIFRRAGEQAYELALPPHMRIHNVFHVSLLKKYVFDPLHILNHDDAILVNQKEFQMEPEQVLEVKERKLRHRTLREVLVKWKGYTVEDASWENWDDLVFQFPHFG
ncbi:hypothetical protein L7F22_057038 [Adiantum nelumboides]|nr:hypothetical protein [Adiantum nelumboides]